MIEILYPGSFFFVHPERVKAEGYYVLIYAMINHQ